MSQEVQIPSGNILEGKSSQTGSGLPREDVIHRIESLESIAKTLPQVDTPIIDGFHAGLYYRMGIIKKGTSLIGYMHKYSHLDIMVSGNVSVSTEDGESKNLTGFNLMFGEPGKKRIIRAHEDTRWLTVHKSEPVPKEDIMSHFTCTSHEEYKNFKGEGVSQLCL
jgi:hypothetical protein